MRCAWLVPRGPSPASTEASVCYVRPTVLVEHVARRSGRTQGSGREIRRGGFEMESQTVARERHCGWFRRRTPPDGGGIRLGSLLEGPVDQLANRLEERSTYRRRGRRLRGLADRRRAAWRSACLRSRFWCRSGRRHGSRLRGSRDALTSGRLLCGDEVQAARAACQPALGSCPPCVSLHGL